MKKQARKINGISVLSVIFSGVLSPIVNAGPYSYLGIELINTPPLTIAYIPDQSAKANLAFKFNLAPYISSILPTVDYRITNKYLLPMYDFNVLAPPAGVVRVLDGDGICSPQTVLQPKQSCIMRFIVDVNNYASNVKSPYICSMHPMECNSPMPGSFIEDVLTKLPAPTQIQVTPMSQDGLIFDPVSMELIGTPIRAGNYYFTVTASNGAQSAESRPLVIVSATDSKDKPMFKDNPSIISAMPNQHYKLNLLDLLQINPGFMLSNQIRFSIDNNESYPDWLSIDDVSATILQGHVPSAELGQIKEVTLIATSNSGGDSSPYTIKIPVVYDPAKKPILTVGDELQGHSGSWLNLELRNRVIDPTHDSNLHIIIDDIQPSAAWLTMTNATELTGEVPENSFGQAFLITMHANTSLGGNSDPVVMPLKIAIDQTQTPKFRAINPQLPMFYIGQPVMYDFVLNDDVFPDYDKAPYVIELAKDYDNPNWLRIENNKLIVDQVPLQAASQKYFYVTIKNIPGGSSQVLQLEFYVT